jgi:5,10-methylenetetrahydromethanopterin reductase
MSPTSAPVRVHIRVPGTAPMPELMRLIRSIEDAGFDGAGILDSQMLSRDTFVTLGQAATHTSRLALFPAVTNPFTRHASVLASAIQTVEELAPERVKFVIGTGYTSASTIGRKAATLEEMRECIATVRTLLAGESARFGETAGRLGYGSGRPIPVLMAASGPKAIEVAGEVADGALLLVGANRGIVARALEHLDRGAKRGGGAGWRTWCLSGRCAPRRCPPPRPRSARRAPPRCTGASFAGAATGSSPPGSSCPR